MRAARSVIAILVFAGLMGFARAGDAPSQQPSEPVRLDALGDPLPAGAYARFGTTRLRHDAKAVAFFDNKTIVSVGSSIRFWDAATGRLIREHRGGKMAETDLAAISADGKRVITRSEQVNYRVWELSTGKLIQEFKTKNEMGLGMFSDGQECISASADGARFAARECDVNNRLGNMIQRYKVYSLNAKKESITLQSGTTVDRLGIISPDGRQIVTAKDTPNGQNEKTALVFWDAATGKKLKSDDPKIGGLGAIQYAPDGKALVLIGEKSVALRTVEGKDIWRRSGEVEGASIGCLTNDRLVLLAPKGEAGDVEAHVVDLASGKTLQKWLVPGSAVTASAVSPDGTRIVVASAGRLRVLNLADGKETVAAPGHSSGIWTTCVTPDGRFLVSTDMVDKDAILWDVASGRIVRRYPHPGACNYAQRSEDGKYLATASDDATVRIWDLASGKELFKLGGFEQPVVCARFLAEKQQLAVLSPMDGGIAVYDYASAKMLREMSMGRMVYPCALYCRADGRLMAIYSTSDADEDAKANANGVPFPIDSGMRKSNGFDLWDVRTRRVVRHFDGYRGGWFHCSLAHDYRTLITHGDDGFIRLWEVATGTQRMRIKDMDKKNDQSEWPAAVEFSPDGLTIACMNHGEPRVDFWDVPTGKRFGSLKGHDEPLKTLDYTPDGRRLLTASTDTTIVGWDVTRPEWRSRPLVGALTEQELAGHWDKLRNGTTEEAYRSKWALVSDPRKTVAFLSERMQAGPTVAADRIRSWIAELDARQYAVRERAQANLVVHFDQAEKELRQALERETSAEARHRINRIIDATIAAIPQPDQLRDLRALEVLEQIGTPEARDVLRRLAASDAPTRVSREAGQSLKRLDERPR